ncbi:MAG: hypothetical protein JKY65_21260 [Planctomycetes bacterium]|nr:hypothetical protein [Planctomycetota bacterium]
MDTNPSRSNRSHRAVGAEGIDDDLQFERREGRKLASGLKIGCSVIAAVLLLGVGSTYFQHRAGIALRKRSSPDAAIGGLREIGSAQSLYREGDHDGDGTLDYTTLAELGRWGLIYGDLAGGVANGYTFEAHPGPDVEFEWFATADPVDPTARNSRYLYTDQTGMIYYSDNAPIQGPLDQANLPPGVFHLPAW